MLHSYNSNSLYMQCEIRKSFLIYGIDFFIPMHCDALWQFLLRLFPLNYENSSCELQQNRFDLCVPRCKMVSKSNNSNFWIECTWKIDFTDFTLDKYGFALPRYQFYQRTVKFVHWGTAPVEQPLLFILMLETAPVRGWGPSTGAVPS